MVKFICFKKNWSRVLKNLKNTYAEVFNNILFFFTFKNTIIVEINLEKNLKKSNHMRKRYLTC